MERVLSSGQISADIDAEQELKRAEALFLWYRFLPGQNEPASIDALQSVILHILSERADGVDLATIKERLESDLGFKDPSRSDELENCLDRLVATGWIIESEGIYQMESQTLRIVTTYERRFTDMMSAFERQITLDAVRVFSVDENKGPVFAKLFLDTLVDIFQSRGREILRVVFDQSPISSSGALELIEIIWKHGQKLSDPRDRPTFVRLVLTAMFEPKGIYDTVLNYFAKAFFCIQALGANKTVNEIVTDVIADRALLIDANILIPLTAQHEDRNEFVSAVIESCRTAGIRLYATEAALEEVRRHASWAANLVDEFGSLSPEVLYAAMGEGGYESNAFLKGFVSVDPNAPDRSFSDYLDGCFNGGFEYDNFRRFFPDVLGIDILDRRLTRDIRKEFELEYNGAYSQISQWNFQRKEENRKTAQRMQSEAEAFVAVTQWDKLEGWTPFVSGTRCSYMTYGTTVGRLGAVNNHSSTRVSVQPEVIWEVLTTLNNSPPASLPDFGSLMNATFFRMSDHFIDKDKYRTFFRPLIDASKAKLENMHPFLREVLGVPFTDEYLDTYPTEDIPALLSSVEGIASRRAASGTELQQKLFEENESLRAQVKEYEERESKRREFVAGQRERDRERRRTRSP